MPPGLAPGRQSPSPIFKDEGAEGRANALAQFVPSAFFQTVTQASPGPVYYQIDNNYRATIQESHDIVSYVDVTRYSQASIIKRRLYPHSGSVTYSADDSTSSSIRFALTDIDGTLTPDIAEDELSPFLSEVRPYRGVIFPDGSQRVVPLGVFRVAELGVDENQGTVTYSVTAYDVSDRLKQKLEDPFVIPAGTKFENAIASLLQSRAPYLDFRLRTTGFTTPALVIEAGKDPWQEAAKLALACGDWLYIARDGVVASEPVRAVDTAPVAWDLVEGDRSIFWGAKRTTKQDAFPNVVKITGGNSASGPVVAIVEDTDPASPTNTARIGKIVYAPVADEKITSVQQAKTKAMAVLQRKLGPSDEITVQAVPNPALMLGQTVQFARAAIGMNRKMVVVHIEMPLLAKDPMAVTLRRSVVTGDDSPTNVGSLVA